MSEGAKAKDKAARTNPVYTSFEGSVNTLKQIEGELTRQADYIEELRRSKDEPIHHDFILQATDCLFRIRTRVALLKDARRRTPDEHVSRLVKHLHVLRTDAEKVHLRVLQDRYSGRRRGGLSRLYREVVSIMKREGADISTKSVWSALQKAGVIRVESEMFYWTDDKGIQKKTSMKQFESSLSRHRKLIR